jgi:hypothetical protein
MKKVVLLLAAACSFAVVSQNIATAAHRGHGGRGYNHNHGYQGHRHGNDHRHFHRSDYRHFRDFGFYYNQYPSQPVYSEFGTYGYDNSGCDYGYGY